MKRGERGFTLIEILVAIAITGAIVAPLAMVITTLLTNPQRSTDQSIVLTEVRNAGYWISRDVHMSANVTATAPTGFPLTLTIPVDATPSNNYSVDYVFEGSKLMRKEYNSSHVLVSQTQIADYIVTGDSTFSTISEDLYKLTIKVSNGSAELTMSYEISQRL